jgi:hypothetical protein
MPRKVDTTPAWKMSYLDPGEVLVDRGGTPEVVVAGVVEPVAEVRGVGVEQGKEVAERQLPVERGEGSERPEQSCVSLVVAGPAGRVDSEEGRPAGHGRDRERPAAVCPAVVEAW